MPKKAIIDLSAILNDLNTIINLIGRYPILIAYINGETFYIINLIGDDLIGNLRSNFLDINTIINRAITIIVINTIVNNAAIDLSNR